MNTTSGKPQAKNNAKRSAEAATKRTGTPHEVFQVDGGWSFRPVAQPETAISWDEPPATTEAAAPAAEKPGPSVEYTSAVQALLSAQGYVTTLLDEPDAKAELKSVFSVGATVGEAAALMASWADEQDEAEFRAAAAADDQSPEAIAKRNLERANARAAAEREKAKLAADASKQREEYITEVFQILAEHMANPEALRTDTEVMDMILGRLGYGEPASEAAGDVIKHFETQDAEGLEAEDKDGVDLESRDLEDAEDAAQAAQDGGEATEAAAPPADGAKPATRGLRAAALAFLEAWDADQGGSDTQQAMFKALEDLRAAATNAKAERPARAAGDRLPKEGTKGAQVIERLRQPEGASGPDLMQMTGWQSHTLRGFFAGLRKRGTPVVALRRVSKADGEGQAFTVYHIPAEAPAPAAN